MRWGFTPSWSKDGSPGPIKARCETAAIHGMFRADFDKRRCAVPVSGFYEWQATPGGKVPHYIHSAEQDGILSVVGLWEVWKKNEQSEPILFLTIITVPPDKMMATLHDRMPAILQAGDFVRWLDPEASPEDVQAFLRPATDGTLTIHTVRWAVNSPRSSGPELISSAKDTETAPAPSARRRSTDHEPSTLFG